MGEEETEKKYRIICTGACWDPNLKLNNEDCVCKEHKEEFEEEIVHGQYLEKKLLKEFQGIQRRGFNYGFFCEVIGYDEALRKAKYAETIYSDGLMWGKEQVQIYEINNKGEMIMDEMEIIPDILDIKGPLFQQFMKEKGIEMPSDEDIAKELEILMKKDA